MRSSVVVASLALTACFAEPKWKPLPPLMEKVPETQANREAAKPSKWVISDHTQTLTVRFTLRSDWAPVMHTESKEEFPIDGDFGDRKLSWRCLVTTERRGEALLLWRLVMGPGGPDETKKYGAVTTGVTDERPWMTLTQLKDADDPTEIATGIVVARIDRAVACATRHVEQREKVVGLALEIAREMTPEAPTPRFHDVALVRSDGNAVGFAESFVWGEDGGTLEEEFLSVLPIKDRNTVAYEDTTRVTNADADGFVKRIVDTHHRALGGRDLRLMYRDGSNYDVEGSREAKAVTVRVTSREKLRGIVRTADEVVARAAKREKIVEERWSGGELTTTTWTPVGGFDPAAPAYSDGKSTVTFDENGLRTGVKSEGLETSRVLVHGSPRRH